MPLGTFTLTIGGERQDGTAETKAKLHLRTQGVDTLIDADADEFKFPTQFANGRGVTIPMPYSIDLFTDTAAGEGESTTIGYKGWVRTEGNRGVEFEIAAQEAGSTVALTDLTDQVVVPISTAQQYVTEAEAARDEAAAAQAAAEAAAASVPSEAELSATYAAKDDPRLAANATPSDVGTRTGTFDASRSLYLPTSNALDGVRAKIAAGATGTARTKIAWVGTSIVLGYGASIGTNSPPVTLRKFLDRRYGATGTGVVPLSTGVTLSTTWTNPDDDRYSASGEWSATGGPRVNNMQLHIQSNVAGRAVTFTSDTPGTVVEIVYFNNSRPFTYSIDGGSAVTVTPTGASVYATTTVTGLADTTHTVTVTVAGTTGSLFLVGVNVRDPYGVELSGFGYYGSISADWLPTAISSAFYNGYKVIDGYNPEVVIVQLGPNELIHSISGGATTLKTNLNTIVSAFKTAGRQVVLAVDPPIESGSVSGWATTYRSAIYDVADTQDVALVDLTHAWRNRTEAAALGYYFDQWHHTATGGAAMAETIFAAIAR